MISATNNKNPKTTLLTIKNPRIMKTNFHNQQISQWAKMNGINGYELTDKNLHLHDGEELMVVYPQVWQLNPVTGERSADPAAALIVVDDFLREMDNFEETKKGEKGESVEIFGTMIYIEPDTTLDDYIQLTINHGESLEITTEGEKEWMEYWDREKRLKDKINAQ